MKLLLSSCLWIPYISLRCVYSTQGTHSCGELTEAGAAASFWSKLRRQRNKQAFDFSVSFSCQHLQVAKSQKMSFVPRSVSLQ